MEQVCLKAYRKLSVLRTVKYLSRQTLDLLYKIMVRSIIDYALPVYFHTLRQTEIKRFEEIQYRAAKLVTGAYHFTSKEKLNLELGWESIDSRANILSLDIFHKIHKKETRPLITSCMPKVNWQRSDYLRSKDVYLPFNCYNTTFSKSFFPYFSKLWNSIGKENQCKDLHDFKIFTNLSMKPPKFKFFSRGYKFSNVLLTRIRVGRSDLNQHKFVIGKIESPECMCHFKEESPQHYFIDCFLYLLERQQLFNLIEHHIPNFMKLSKKLKLNIILNGLEPENIDFVHLNTILTKAV